MALWVEVEVQRQFVQDGLSNIHVYVGLSGRMQEWEYDQSAQQCCVKVKALGAQWATITDYNHWSGTAQQSIPFLWQLDSTLVPWDPGRNHAVYCSTSSLPEPLL